MSNKIFFTPGPTQLFYTVEQHLKEAFKNDIGSISHRGKAFEAIYRETQENLHELLGLNSDFDIYFTSSANEIWERIVQNLVEKNSYHFVNGAFSKKFAQFASDYKKAPIVQEVADGQHFDTSLSGHAGLIAVTLNETSIGYGFPVNEIYNLRKQNPEAFLAVDGVSVFPCVDFDFSKIDTAYFSVQKSFGLPSGLGVWIVNKRCMAEAERLSKQGQITGSYHSLLSLKKDGDKNQTPETPNTLFIYLLGKVAMDLLDRGIKNVRNETIYKSTLLYQSMEKSRGLNPFIKDEKYRSKTVIVADCKEGSASLISAAKEKGWVIGSGYGQHKDKQIRIANFPMHSREQIEQLSDFLLKY